MQYRSVSKCCHAQVKALQGANIVLCRGYHRHCPQYHNRAQTIIFQCTKCGKATRIIVGQITDKEAAEEAPMASTILPLPKCSCSLFPICDFAKQYCGKDIEISKD